MTTDVPSWKRSPADTTSKNEEAEGSTGVMRPVARRLAPKCTSSQGADQQKAGGPAFLSAPGDSLGNPAKQQWRSAWAKYETPAPTEQTSETVVQKAAVPPTIANVALATQHAARQLWERQAAVESDTTDSATPPPDSPSNKRQQVQAGQPAGVAQLPGALSIQDAYISSLKAALSQQTELTAQHSGSSLPRAPQLASSNSAAILAQPGGLASSTWECALPSNGSLSILPEAVSRAKHLAPPTQDSLSGQSNPGSAIAHIARLSHQLGEMLRNQTFQSHHSGQLPMITQEPMLYTLGSVPMAMPGTPHPSFARFSSEEGFRDQDASIDYDSLRSDSTAAVLANRRWNSTGSFASDASLHASASLLQQQLQPGAVPNLSRNDNHALLHSIHLLCQANEMAVLAQNRIQAFSMAANANLEGLTNASLRKRKISDFYEGPPKRHNSMMSEGEAFAYTGGHTEQGLLGACEPAVWLQICAECGTRSTPTWRRSEKRLMCNACGLRRSRSMRSARSNPPPMAGPLGTHSNACDPKRPVA